MHAAAAAAAAAAHRQVAFMHVYCSIVTQVGVQIGNHAPYVLDMAAVLTRFASTPLYPHLGTGIHEAMTAMTYPQMTQT